MSDLGQTLRTARGAILGYCNHEPGERGDRYGGNCADTIVSGYMERKFGEDDLSFQSPRWTYLRTSLRMAKRSTGYETQNNSGGFQGRLCAECQERKRENEFYRDSQLGVLSDTCIACQRAEEAA